MQKQWTYGLLLLIALPILLMFFPWLRVPRTVQFDSSLPYTEIDGYKFHTEVFGRADAPTVIIVHGGPGLDYEYLKPLKALSKNYRVIFYDQRGTGLSPRVDKKDLTIEQSVADLHLIVGHFSNGEKVRLIGHSWGATLVTGYVSKYPETVFQAVMAEPAFLYPGDDAREWAGKLSKIMPSIGEMVRYALAYPYVKKEDGHEGLDYAMTQVANRNAPGPPYNCEGEELPVGSFKRTGYAAYDNWQGPMIKNPDSLAYDFLNGISGYHGDLMLIGSECSIIGYEFQEKYFISKLPSRTIHVKAEKMGHHMFTLNTDWSIQTIGKFFKP